MNIKISLPSREGWARGARIVVAIWAILIGVFAGAMSLLVPTPSDQAAIFRMAAGLIIIWVALGGAAMVRFREPFVRWARRIPLDWRLRFALLCIVFALLEEAVTTTMTNLAPYLGAVSDAAKITASKNYLEVVLMHSVIVFVPMFFGWAFLLHRYDFRPIEVFLLYGVTGVLAEASSFGLQNLGGAGFWICVYGWMVYLPACTIPEERVARPVKAWHALLAVFLPFVAGIPFVPLVLLVQRVYRAFSGS